jgi:hypothetical protein
MQVTKEDEVNHIGNRRFDGAGDQRLEEGARPLST